MASSTVPAANDFQPGSRGSGNQPSSLRDLESGLHSPAAATKTEYLTHIPEDYMVAIERALGGPPHSEHSLIQHFWPAFGLKEGIYKQVTKYRYFAQYKFYLVSVLYNLCLIAQLVLGAALTSLSAAASTKNGIAITIIAAANTVNAGVLALLHGSGLPARLRSDMTEYEKVATWMEEVMRGGVALGVVMTGTPGDNEVTVRDRVVGEATKRFLKARGTVEKNKPSAYSGHSSQHTSPGSHAPTTHPTGTGAGTAPPTRQSTAIGRL
ncbi:hypothetical protein HYALB_00007818 [Hymenoscyphus albidus]|uniref:SMODS and SLOG-associating 2TM effector domain-containing protein n=1 Tax=Hymenoscyphus albidus TaxID=595503 RepID=A0A9N9LG04_9HELO|nr:hypothetical protein HYALB_00007818 [Hymenoscyphus albidus]